MTTYMNVAGTRLEVEIKGRGFVTKRYYLASKRIPAEMVEKFHKCYSAVEKLIKRQSFELIEVRQARINK